MQNSLLCNEHHQPRSRRQGQSLIGLLAVTLILIGLYFMFLGPRLGKDGKMRPSVAKQSINRAQDVSVNSNIQQIQMSIDMYKNDNDGKPPASLEELKKYCKFPEEMWINPETKQPLVYDPATGTISASAQPGAGTAAAGSSVPGVSVDIPQPRVPTDDQ